MIDHLFQLDHVGVVVPDLDQAAANYKRLGFQLTPRSSHKGPLQPGGPDELWGSGNHCVMFRQGYLELLGITDPNRYCTHVKERLARYHGLHLIALGCADAEETADIVGARVTVEPAAEFGRDVPYGDATQPGRFRIVRVPDEAFPEAELFFIEHLTPEVLWQPELLPQPNGVVALAGVVLCVPDPIQTAARLEAILATSASEREGMQCIELTPGSLWIGDQQSIAKRYPGAVLPPPCVAAARYQVADLAATRRLLENNGLEINTVQSAIWVDPQAAEGTVVEFTESD